MKLLLIILLELVIATLMNGSNVWGMPASCTYITYENRYLLRGGGDAVGFALALSSNIDGMTKTSMFYFTKRTPSCFDESGATLSPHLHSGFRPVLTIY